MSHQRISDYVLMGLTLSMFITNLVLIFVLVGYSYRVSVSDERYAALRQDYLIRIEESERKVDIKFNRLHETVTALQFTTDKRINLINETISRQ